MYGSGGNQPDANADHLFHTVLSSSSECQETAVGSGMNMAHEVFALLSPGPCVENNPRPEDQLPDTFCFLEHSFPETPAEPPGQLQEYPYCPPGQVPELSDAVSSFLHEDLVFTFLDTALSGFSSSIMQQTWMTSAARDDQITFMETPPATPTDHDTGLECLTTQPLHCPPPPPPPPTCPPAPPLCPPPPPRRARLQGTSFCQDDNLRDLDVLDDIVFSDTEIPTSEESEMPAAQSVQPNFLAEADPVKALPVLGDEENMERLKEAWHRSQGSQSLVPILKEELRLKIMKKRHDNGQEELKIDFTSGSAVHPMTPEDTVRRDVRRAQNRGAAQRFREKKKLKEAAMKKKLEDGVKANTHLSQQVALLRREVKRLQQLIYQHRDCPDFRLQFLPTTTLTTTATTTTTDFLLQDDFNNNNNNNNNDDDDDAGDDDYHLPFPPTSTTTTATNDLPDDDDRHDDDDDADDADEFKVLCQRIVEDISSMQPRPR